MSSKEHFLSWIDALLWTSKKETAIHSHYKDGKSQDIQIYKIVDYSVNIHP